MNFLYIAALALVVFVAYCMGVRDGSAGEPSEEAWIIVQKYEIDRKYAHWRWLEERGGKHE